MEHSRKARGSTLVEMVVVLGILSLILGVLMDLILFGERSWQSGSSQTVLNGQLRKALDRVSRELEEGGNGTVNFTSQGADGWFRQMSFQVPQDDGMGEDEDLPADPPSDPTKYTHRWVNGQREPETVFRYQSNPQNPGRLLNVGLEWSPPITLRWDTARDMLIREAQGVETALASHVTDVWFRPVGADMVELEIVAQVPESNLRTVGRTLRSRVKLRN